MTGFVVEIAEKFGVPEQGIKLLLSLLAVYVVAAIHHAFTSKLAPFLQHVYFIVTSSTIYYWNYGSDITHAYVCIVVQWLIIVVWDSASLFPLLLSFAFQLSYLVWGYYYYLTDDYDINWLMPHCVLTLRLIGLAFDLYDGHKDAKLVTREQQDRKLTDKPSLIELAAFSFFPSGFLIGPQFPLVRVRALVNGTLIDQSVSNSGRYVAAFTQLFVGILFLAIHSQLAATYNTEFYLTDQFKEEMTLVGRSSYVAVAGYLVLLRYVVVWMINEGSCIIFGVGYQRDKETGADRWDAVRNARLGQFLTATSFQGLINCFNMNTNDWVARYIFKRLRFAGSRLISHSVTLLFLAIWHGVHTGYFTCFAYEFLLMSVEKPMLEMFGGMIVTKRLRNSALFSWIPSLVGFCYFHALAGYALIDFTLLKWHRYKPVLDSLYWQGHIFFLTFLVVVKINRAMAPKRKDA